MPVSDALTAQWLIHHPLCRLDLTSRSCRQHTRVQSSRRCTICAGRVSSSASASGNTLENGLAELASTFATGVRRLQSLSQPLPPGFPPGPGGDAALAMLADPLDFLTQTSAQYGGLVGLRLGGENVVLVSDPGAARRVLVDDAASFVKEGTAFFPGSRLAGNGLLVSDGAVWRRQRRLSNPAFRKSAVQAYSKAMEAAAQRLVREVWAQGGTRRDAYRDFNALTLRIVTDALFGTDLPASAAAEVTDAIKVAFEHFAGRAATGFIVPEWLPTPDNVQYGRAVARLDAVVYDVIRQRRCRQGHEESACLLDALLAARDEASGDVMDDAALRDELMTILVAGQETSAIVLGWTCALLAQHPAAQAEVFNEVSHLLGGAPPNAHNTEGLNRLVAAVLESLRLQPPAYLVGRCAASACTLGDYSIPAGTTLLVSPYLLHRLPTVWPKADEYVPDRWLPYLTGVEDSGTAAASGKQAPAERRDKSRGYMGLMSDLGPNSAFLPFGAGPRNCIGTGFAMMEALLVLAAIVQRFELRLPPGNLFPRPNAKITLRPEAVRLDLVLRRRS